LNAPLARALGLDPERLATPDGVAVLSGNRVPDGAEPVAMAYAGHQFGNWVPQLGDGRAILLGEITDRDGVRRDIHLKGAGRTPFSRGGDGRAALGPVLREYILSEAMAALGVPTTRALAAVTTGEQILRQDGPLPGAILTRIARSHVRIGTFEFFANRGDRDGVRVLADYVMARHYPDCARAENPYRAFLDAVIDRVASLVAHWMNIGFIHGVMNTDNMSIAGETIDYGPCAFMDRFHPATVFSSIDSHGRYAYGNQPRIAHWNLVRLTEALLPLLGADEQSAIASAQEAIDAFPAKFDAAQLAGFRRKLGLSTEESDDTVLLQDLFELMAKTEADFANTFRGLANGADLPEALADWSQTWRARLARENKPMKEIQAGMRAVNPAFIPRNHRVEAALAAAQSGDLRLVDELIAVLARPFEDQPGFARYADPPKPDEVVKATFCGT
jgi:uncharacterized protein YdiU (UPF0061 family)